MSFRVSSTPLLSGAFAVSPYAGLGVLGSDIPSEGDNGPSPLLNDGIVASSEYAWYLDTPPSAGALTLYPDGTFIWDAVGVADGTYTFTYRLYEDGIDSGIGTVYLSAGTTTVALVVADLAHGHALDAVVLSVPVSGDTGLIIGDLSHSHTIDAATLATHDIAVLSIGDINHAHALDVMELHAPLPGVSSLEIDGLLHTSALDLVEIGFYGSVDLAVFDLAHAHALDGVLLNFGVTEYPLAAPIVAGKVALIITANRRSPIIAGAK